MTTASDRSRSLLPMAGPHGSRNWATCFYRCGNACDKPEPNTSGNEHVSSVIETALRRRSLLGGAAVGSGALVVGGLTASPAAAERDRPRMEAGRARASEDDWEPVEPNVRDRVTVPRGYTSSLVAAWGDPVVKGAPRFDVRRQTSESAAQQFGYNCDYVCVLPLGKNSALLVVNHEYTNEELMFPEGVYDAETIRKIAIQSHGMSVLQIQRKNGQSGNWKRSNPAASRYNRRITGTTPFLLDGPAAGNERLQTTEDPSGRHVLGTLNNCSGGTTPWGTVLSGEENFNQYFDASGEIDARYQATYARYGIAATNSRKWSTVDPRFDLTKEPHEPFRFGWIVEIDPMNPTSVPRKHTMLGRFKHEGANVIIADSGHAVAYMGDDEKGDYLYKFVSADKMARGKSPAARKRNLNLLTEGTLYVAKLTGDGDQDGRYDGTGSWIPLASNTKSYVNGMTLEEVLIDTRLAADKVQPTRMDRPEDVEPNPVNGRIYAALTNNSDRGTKWPTDEANPLGSSTTRAELGGSLTTTPGNRNGYVLEMSERRGDHTGRSFTWTLMLVCGDPKAPETYFAGFPKHRVSPISCPDNVAFDSHGNLWVSTDGNSLGSNDGIFRVPVAGRKRGQVQQYLTVPVGAEACGPLISDADRSVWCAVQHPGEGGTFAEPTSTWPHTHDFPRPGVVVSHHAK